MASFLRFATHINRLLRSRTAAEARSALGTSTGESTPATPLAVATSSTLGGIKSSSDILVDPVSGVATITTLPKTFVYGSNDLLLDVIYGSIPAGYTASWISGNVNNRNLSSIARVESDAYEVGASAFAGCGALTVAKFTRASFGANALANCSALTDVYVACAPSSIAEDAFAGSSITTVHIASRASLLGSPPSGWTRGLSQSAGGNSVNVVADWVVDVELDALPINGVVTPDALTGSTNVPGVIVSGIVDPAGANGFYEETADLDTDGLPIYVLRPGWYRLSLDDSIGARWGIMQNVPDGTPVVYFFSSARSPSPANESAWYQASGVGTVSLEDVPLIDTPGTYVGQMYRAGAPPSEFVWYRWNGSEWEIPSIPAVGIQATGIEDGAVLTVVGGVATWVAPVVGADQFMGQYMYDYIDETGNSTMTSGVFWPACDPMLGQKIKIKVTIVENPASAGANNRQYWTMFSSAGMYATTTIVTGSITYSFADAGNSVEAHMEGMFLYTPSPLIVGDWFEFTVTLSSATSGTEEMAWSTLDGAVFASIVEMTVI